MTKPPDPLRPRLYRARDESVWALIRQRYLSGETQKALALAYDVSLAAIQKRISREGWSKRAAIGIRPTFGGMAAPRDFEIIRPQERWPEAYEAAPPPRTGEPGEGERAEGERWESWKAPPPGQGPMPPERMPTVERPPSGPPAAEARSPAEVAEQAVAAAGRAIAEGRYAEAERLGKLAETMRRLEGAGPVRARAAPEEEEKEEEGRNHPFAGQDAAADDLPAEDRPLNCTARTCAMEQVRKTLEARLDGLCDDLLEPEIEDLEDWTDMAQAIGAVCDPDVARLCDVIRAEGLDDIRPEVEALFGPAPHRPARPRFDPYR